MKVERTKKANLLVICSTFWARKVVVQKMSGDVEMDIYLGGSFQRRMNVKGSFMVWMWSWMKMS